MTDCILCGEQTRRFPDYNKLKNVTSDSKPYSNISWLTFCAKCGHVQKEINENFLRSVSQIYKDYEVFKLSGGVEQAIFIGSQVASRSEFLAKWLKNHISLNGSHSVLDFGCGDCSALCSLSKVFPAAQFYGYEIENIPRPKLDSVRNFRELIISDRFEPKQKFDLISLIHCLEHLEDPVNALRNIHDHINDGGYLFVEVPDLDKSDYDILIADHISHFNLSLLVELLETIGFEIVDASSNILVKELTVLAQKNDKKEARIKPNSERVKRNFVRTKSLIDAHLDTVEASKAVMESNENIGIFGSSNAAMWLWGELGQQIKIFVDEDKSKHRKLKDFEIVCPRSVQDGYIIVVPLSTNVASTIVSKYSTEKVRFLKV